MFQNFIVKQLNADAQEPSANTTEETTATTNLPAEATEVAEVTAAVMPEPVKKFYC
jgi:hypothetical protein